jgi:hypothetical protein
MSEANIKQAAIQDLCKAIRYGRTNIQTMYYESSKDRVIIETAGGSLIVNTAGDSLLAMLCDVMDAVRKYEGM